MTRDEDISQAAEHIRNITPDVGNQMILAAFAMETIDHEYGTGPYANTKENPAGMPTNGE